MAKVTTSAGDDLFYREDCFAPPWENPTATLLLHAEAETGDAWYAWVPRMAARARLIRPDMRGAGRSVAMRPGQAWSLDRLAFDVLALMDALGVASAHLVAARVAGPVAMHLAATAPSRVLSLALCSSTPDPARHFGPSAGRWAAAIEQDGMDAWAVEAAQERLGADAEEQMLHGWADMLAAADGGTLLSLLRSLPSLGAAADLAAITCPTLVVTTGGNTAVPLEDTIAWQRQIAPAELMVLVGGGEHVAATHARDLAGAVQDFQRKAEKEAGAGKRGRDARRRPRDDAQETPRRGRGGDEEAPRRREDRPDRGQRRDRRG